MPSNSADPAVPAKRLVAYCSAIASVAAAVIHFAVAGSHFQEYWVFGVFMLTAGWLQLTWAILAIARPTRAVLCGGAVLSANIIAIYVLTPAGSSHMRMPAAHRSLLKLATSTPGGDITMPDPDMQMAPGMAMASSAACTAKPTAGQQRAAVALVKSSWRGASRFRSLAAAKAAGCRAITPPGLPVVH